MPAVNIRDSNLVPEGASVSFASANFVCRKKGGETVMFPASDIIEMNRVRPKKISGAPAGGPFRNLFYAGAVIAIFMEIFGLASDEKTAGNTPLILKFKGGGYLFGSTDQDTFFKIQNAWLDSK